MDDPTALDDVYEPLRLPEDRTVVTAQQAAARVLEGPGLRHVVGAEGCAPALLARALRRRGRQVLLVTADTDSARRAAADLAYLAHPLPFEPRDAGTESPEPEPLLLLASESSPYAQVHLDRRAAMTRASALCHVAAGRPWSCLVATAAALVRRVVPAELLLAVATCIETASEIDLGQVTARLAAGGYLRVAMVEDPGSFAVRGGLLDVWPPHTSLPVRIELCGDVVSRIRCFDPDDQRTTLGLREVWLPPAREDVLTEQSSTRAREVMRSLCDSVNLPSTRARQLVEDVSTGKAFFGSEGYLPAFAQLSSLLDYLTRDSVLLIKDGADVLAALRAELRRGREGEAQRRGAPHFPASALYLNEPELRAQLGVHSVLVTHRAGVTGPSTGGGLDGLELVSADVPTMAVRDHADLGRAVQAARSARGRRGALDPIVRRIEAWFDCGLHVVIAARGATQAARVATLLSHRGLAIHQAAGDQSESDQQVRDESDLRSRPRVGTVHVSIGPLARGGIAPAEGFVLVTEEEIFGQRAHRRAQRGRSPRSLLQDLRVLAPGDVVVHVQHGKGRYLGLERKQIGGVGVELIAVEYAGGDKLFVPVYRLDQIQKYSGGEANPRLDRLGGQSFAKAKARVQRRVRQMADQLLRLYAERASLTKTPLPEPDDEYAAFEASFPFEETRDQALAIQEVMHDLSSDRVMDRLICGDVGFGKTEVALRAAFRNALCGRQTAVLCPTTVLVQQHGLTFCARLQDYPITVRTLSRFQSKAAQQATLKGLKNGGVDIVIGTHRLLSKDVHFKHLGLLVVDEEHRFGVSHKERIKQLRARVDALALSATPIPRSLQMAVTGLRDMSLITTPPVDRRAIRTLTSRFDEDLVREAIEREMSRGGQVFYVYNRIEHIYERAARVQAIVPRARLAVVHGQLEESTLEQTMLDFVHGHYDVLVTTAIIESGLDIPRANTILIDRADIFGLAQLYQLRGRVGRSSERAYCHLLVPPPSQLTDDARSRIEALERFTELGSGFHVATLDLELRGAGNLLGAEQSGFVASVGFELYCQMLEEATRELRGEPLRDDVDPELSFDVEALLPEDYVSEVGLRLSLYKRLASCEDEGEVVEVASEMEDRFGAAPPEARRLVELMGLKTKLRKLRALGVEASARSVALHLRDDTPLDPSEIGKLVAQQRELYKLTPSGRLTRRAERDTVYPSGLELTEQMLSELAGCVGAEPGCG
jgi:transcription-repair coupling factor (superfamily II helicase)